MILHVVYEHQGNEARGEPIMRSEINNRYIRQRPILKHAITTP